MILLKILLIGTNLLLISVGDKENWMLRICFAFIIPLLIKTMFFELGAYLSNLYITIMQKVRVLCQVYHCQFKKHDPKKIELYW